MRHKGVRKMEQEKVLVFVGSHPDDEVLSAGALLIKAVGLGFRIHFVWLTRGEGSQSSESIQRPVEAQAVADRLSATYDLLKFPDGKLYLYEKEIMEKVENILKKIKPAIVVWPFGLYGDQHQDHHVLHNVFLRIQKRWESEDCAWLMGQPPVDSDNAFKPTFNLQYTESRLDEIMNLMYCYKSESSKHFATRDFHENRAQRWSFDIHHGKGFLEPFQAVRGVPPESIFSNLSIARISGPQSSQPSYTLNIPMAHPSGKRHAHQHRKPLTPRKPIDTPKNRHLWRSVSERCELTRLLMEKEATILVNWQGVPLEKMIARYDEKNAIYPRYDKIIPETANTLLSGWKRQNPKDFRRYQEEPWGLQVRLEGWEYDHREYKHIFHLSPTKYLYYVSLQARLWHPDIKFLRNEVFENALLSLNEGLRPLLPNHFALHMAIVCSDNKLLIRHRPDNTKLYPGVWEASIGEFMHGPEHKGYAHFTENGNPDLTMFCKNAVAEETNYNQAAPDHFRAYGFGIEWRTLAPKLYIVYRCDKSIAYLLEQGQPEDPGKELSSIELTPRALGEAFAPSSGYVWSPSSRIISLIALKESTQKANEQHSLLEEFKEVYQA